RDSSGQIRLVQEGDIVERGNLLVRIKNSEYLSQIDQAQHQIDESSSTTLSIESQMNKAEAAVEKTRIDFERAKNLYEKESLTKPDYETAQSNYVLAKAELESVRAQAKAAKQRIEVAKAALKMVEASYRDTTLYAPISGVLIKRSVEIGSLTQPGIPAFTIADINSVKVVFSVPDKTIHSLKIGQLLTVTIDSIAESNFQGRITAIAPYADSKTRLFEIEVTITNSDKKLKPGMIASIKLESEKQKELLTVPVSSIIRSDRGDYAVFVVEEENGKTITKLYNVTLGEPYGNSISILSGLALSSKVVVSGAAQLTNGEIVQIVP
ncbi:MAG: efflux RND transporter periplasmic adaptor subunit, partial [Blastocatellia bacterium]|nr:efflux RND transporter periplasmic adaptor subunit [Blastocatellia bacterium]